MDIWKVINYTSQDRIFNTEIYSPIYPSIFSITANMAYHIQNLPSERLWISIIDLPSQVPSSCRTAPYYFSTSALSILDFVSSCHPGYLRMFNRIVTNITDLLLVLPPQTNSIPFRVSVNSEYCVTWTANICIPRVKI